jgi:DNA-binding XRE family transcriptional regulator
MPTKTRPRSQTARRASSVSVLQTVRVVRVNQEPVLELRNLLKMKREDFGRLVDVSVRALAAVEREAADVAKLKRPYTEVARLYEALSEVVEREAIGPWFVTPNEAFGGLKPMEVIERGEIDRLWGMVHRLQSGMPG